MAALLALISAVLFALAATLQQRGQFVLARKGKAIQGVAGLLGLVLVPLWLLGTVILLCGYATQGVALDRGKLVVVQPLLVTTIVWALPLGYLLTNQRVTRRQCWVRSWWCSASRSSCSSATPTQASTTPPRATSSS